MAMTKVQEAMQRVGIAGATVYDPDNPVDSSAAVQAWLQAGGGDAGPDTYYCESRVVVSNVNINAHVNLLFNTSGAGGVQITQDAVQKVRLSGSIRTTYDGDGLGLHIIYTDTSLIENRKQEEYVDLSGLLIANDPASLHTAKNGYFTKGIVLKNVQEPNLENVKIWGSADSTVVADNDPAKYWPAGTIGLELQTDATATAVPQPTISDFSNLTIGRVETAVKVSANFEGLIFKGGEFVVCMDGISIAPQTLYSGSDWITHILLDGVHINAARSWVTGGKVFSLHLSSCKFNRFGVLQGQDFTGLDLTDVDRLVWVGGDFNAGSNLTGVGSTQAGKFENVNRANIVGVLGFRCPNGIEITDANTRNIYVDDASSIVSDDTDTAIDWLYTSGTGDLKYQINQTLVAVNGSSVALTGGSLVTVVENGPFSGVYTGQVYEVRFDFLVAGDAAITPTEYNKLAAFVTKVGTCTGAWDISGEAEKRASTFNMPKSEKWGGQTIGRYTVTSGDGSDNLRFDGRLLIGTNTDYPADVAAGDAAMTVRRIK